MRFNFLRRKPRLKPLTTEELLAFRKPYDQLSLAEKELVRIIKSVHRNGGKYIPEDGAFRR